MAFGFSLYALGKAQSLKPQVQSLIESDPEKHRERVGFDIAEGCRVVALQHITEALVEAAFD